MGICYYLINREKREAFDLDKGWPDLMEQFGELPLTREAFDRAVLRTRCGWAITTPEEWEDMLTWPVHGATRHEREVKLLERCTLHASGYYVLKHDGIAPYDFDVEKGYAQEIADKLWVFCERHAWNVELINDAGDPPWWDEGGWMCVASRFATTRTPFSLSERVSW